MKSLFDLYATYMGEKYKASVVIDDGIWIFSDDKGEMNKGFQYDKKMKRYELFVKLTEIDGYFRKDTYGDFRGHTCYMMGESESTYEICAPETMSMEERNALFERVDKGDYRKMVEKGQITNIRYNIEEYDLDALRNKGEYSILREYVTKEW